MFIYLIKLLIAVKYLSGPLQEFNYSVDGINIK